MLQRGVSGRKGRRERRQTRIVQEARIEVGGAAARARLAATPDRANDRRNVRRHRSFPRD
jgi:hypothetical protein